MKKTIFALIAITFLISSPLLVSADLDQIPVPGPTQTSISGLLTKALQWIFNITIFLAAIFLVFAGIMYVTSGGDQDKVKKALNTLMYALIGVAVAVLAKSLIYIIGKMFGATLQL